MRSFEGVRSLPSRLRLNELFVYDNGKLLNRIDRSCARRGQEAGTFCKDIGYRKVYLDGGTYYTHRLIWKLLYGEDPVEIDHINGSPSDNRITNLRSVSRLENARNMKKMPSNTSGVTGVFWIKDRSKWRVSISQKILGEFNKFEDAVAARKQAEEEYGYHPNHGRGER
jgi:hypothetical protein